MRKNGTLRYKSSNKRYCIKSTMTYLVDLVDIIIKFITKDIS